MVARVAIKKREKRAPGCRVNNLVDARERKRVFRAVLVEICIVNNLRFAFTCRVERWSSSVRVVRGDIGWFQD